MPCQAERKLTFWAEICLDNSFCCHVSVCWRLALRGFCCTLSCDGHHETQRAHADIIDHDNAASHRVMVASLASHCVQTLRAGCICAVSRPAGSMGSMQTCFHVPWPTSKHVMGIDAGMLSPLVRCVVLTAFLPDGRVSFPLHHGSRTMCACEMIPADSWRVQLLLLALSHDLMLQGTRWQPRPHVEF